jgi:hypothetical protein
MYSIVTGAKACCQGSPTLTMQKASVGSARKAKSAGKSTSSRVTTITALCLHARPNLTVKFGTSTTKIARPTAKMRKKLMPTICVASLALLN